MFFPTFSVVLSWPWIAPSFACAHQFLNRLKQGSLQISRIFFLCNFFLSRTSPCKLQLSWFIQTPGSVSVFSKWAPTGLFFSHP